ncbi:related to 20S-pre-rRNA D-site endonuclease NOB1 [Saccharomycodes ludwigii]|uniref:20S-pre-rRNA D-site endonuclease NOB1 n=1 Tax=Saccharomycodes ludwigii TaxID=36035 RepID=A0A376B451_9ASCO|nr:related to 20S-pre-rRNA D-site endonuclease NOB1 [Saccharomycodes ludwigii]
MFNANHTTSIPDEDKKIDSLVLDATPLITQSYQHLKQYASKFYTTPTVYNEIRDANARKNLEVWDTLGVLHKRHPKESSIKYVSNFSKLTGDYQVLSANDIHIIALTYELEVELNGTDKNVRKRPGEILPIDLKRQELEEKRGKELKKEEQMKKKTQQQEEREKKQKNGDTTREEKEEEKNGEGKKKRTRRGGKKQRIKKELAAAIASNEADNNNTAQETGIKDKSLPNESNAITNSSLDFENGEYFADEDEDGDWITPLNIATQLMKDNGEDTVGGTALNNEMYDDDEEKVVALCSGDFAVQNVVLQMNLKLMNFMNGLRIKKLRNYMLRCHACFKMVPLPKSEKQVHFCPSCGGYNTVLRCAVSIDTSGKIIPHLKKNFQWSNRGNRYSLASPLSKNSVKKYGKKGYDHGNPVDVVILREDQKEYEQSIKQEEWTRKHNEKVLNDYLGSSSSGSADNIISPFVDIDGLKHHKTRIGKGRYVNRGRNSKK